MSGHALMLLLLGEGACDMFWLQCHQPLIGAPSPIQANQPWYPTVIFPTTSPAGLAADAGEGHRMVVADAAADPATAVTAVASTARRDRLIRLGVPYKFGVGAEVTRRARQLSEIGFIPAARSGRDPGRRAERFPRGLTHLVSKHIGCVSSAWTG